MLYEHTHNSSYTDELVKEMSDDYIPGDLFLISGTSGTGKSILSMRIAAELQKQGVHPIYVNTERLVDSSLFEESGLDVNNATIIHESSSDYIKQGLKKIIFNASKSHKKVALIIDGITTLNFENKVYVREIDKANIYHLIKLLDDNNNLRLIATRQLQQSAISIEKRLIVSTIGCIATKEGHK